jgi:AcrR family transcriptional regulator
MPTRLPPPAPVAKAAADQSADPTEFGSACTARGAGRLRRLRHKAAELFLRHGYEAVSVDDLIAEVGGSKRNVYEHFGGKHGLFVAAVQEVCAEATAPLTGLPMAKAGVEQGLVLYGRHTLRALLQPRALDLHRLSLSDAGRHAELGAVLQQSGCEAASRALGVWVAARQGRAELRADCDAESLAAQFLCLLVSRPQMQALTDQLPADWEPHGLEQHVDLVVDLFLNGARPPHLES